MSKVMERYCRKCRQWTLDENWKTGVDTCGDCWDDFSWWRCPSCDASYDDHVSTNKPSRRRNAPVNQVKQ